MPDAAAGPRRYILTESNYRQLLDYQPNVAVLPWGATEAHNYHLPHGTDVIEATEVATKAAEMAHRQGVRPIVLPTIPFGNNEQQLDQVATISFSTSTALAILNDTVRSLSRQGIDRLVILNGHGGNQFKPIVRDISARYDSLIVVANFYELCPDTLDIFDEPLGHACEMETSFLLHVCPDLVQMELAGDGSRVPFEIEGLSQPGVWTPRPWSQSHPDTGCGDPSKATAEKGEIYVRQVTEALCEVLVGLSNAKKGQLPYVEHSAATQIER